MGVSGKRRKEIRQGFRTVGNLLLGFLTAILILIGTIYLSGGDTGRVGTFESLAAYVGAVAILYWKAEGYSGCIAGFFGLSGVFNSIAVLISGHALNQPDVPVSHTEALFGLVFCVALAVLTFPFTKPRDLDRMSRVSIVFAVLAFFFGIVNPRGQYAWLTLCLFFFGFAVFHILDPRELRLPPLTRNKLAKKGNRN